MNSFRNFSLASVVLITSLGSAFAGTTVTSPVNGSNVSSPFNLVMSADTCSDRPVTAVGYSFDDNPHSSVWADNAINGPVMPPQGWHKLHVKVWNDQGQVCVTDVAVNAADQITPNSPIPSGAISVSAIQAQSNWIAAHDAGTSGDSSGWTAIAGSPSLSGSARAFSSHMSHYAGHRFAVHFGDDRDSTDFLYDTYVYIEGKPDGISNLEFDLNQTLPNGETVIMGFQCDGWSKTWDYTQNAGSAKKPKDQWANSSAPCNPQDWAPNQWHHLQIRYSHDPSGWVTYKYVQLDDNRQDINVNVFSSFALGWGSALMTNFQVGSKKPGEADAKIYLDKLTITRW